MSQVKKAKDTRHEDIKRIETYLRNYKNYHAGLIAMKKQLEYIMPNITASYEVQEGSTGTFNIKSDTEKYAIDRIESKRALILHEGNRQYEIILESIDPALNGLDELERDFIKIRYFKRKTIQQTSVELGYSEKYVYDLRHQIMDRLLISLKGLIQFCGYFIFTIGRRLKIP